MKQILIGIAAFFIVCVGNTSTILASQEALTAPENAKWNHGTGTIATWRKVPDATGYQLRLYFDDEYIQTVHVKSNRADLEKYMNEEGWYYYEVRAVAENKAGVKTRPSSEYTVSEDMLLDNLGEIGGRWRSYVNGRRYQRLDGSCLNSGWQRIQGKWYFLDDNGYVVTGWKQVDGTWYYMNAEGVMQTGWIDVDGARYCMDGNGAMRVGWVQLDPARWCYMDENGAMVKNAVIDGYAIDADGIWAQK